MGTKRHNGADKIYSIHAHTVRRREIDLDNQSFKAVIDGLVAKGLFADDKAAVVKHFTTSQEKGDEEKTIISLWEIK